MNPNRGNKWIGGLSAALLLSAALSGCVHNPGDTQGDLKQYSGPVKIKSLEQTRLEESSAPSVVPITQIHHVGYVALGDVARAIGFHGQWLQGDRFGIGDRDAAWTFKAGDSAVDTGDRTVRMPGPAVKESSKLYVPVSALQTLFADTAEFRSDGVHVSFFPRPPRTDRGADDLALPFPEGSPAARSPRMQATANGDNGGNDAAYNRDGTTYNGDGTTGNGNDATGNGSAGPSANGGDNSAVSSGNRADLIADAKKYLGVRYQFGSEDYDKSGTFDCSSFTRFIFAKYGVTLPRTARDQGKLGTAVSKSELEPGDLVFFSVPGRFKSDSTVGHVGIYMGGGEMINANSEPQDGVQITDINKPYWQRVFLFAKRVLS